MEVTTVVNSVYNVDHLTQLNTADGLFFVYNRDLRTELLNMTIPFRLTAKYVDASGTRYITEII